MSLSRIIHLSQHKIINMSFNLFADVSQCNCFVGEFIRAMGGVTGNAGRGAYDRGFVQLASLFLKGEILYTPDNNVTRNIIGQVRTI